MKTTIDVPARHRGALEYLESLQKQVALAFRADVSPKDEADYLELADALLRSGAHPPGTDRMALAQSLQNSHQVPDPERWSAYERPDHRQRLWHAEQSAIRGMDLLGYALPTPLPALGTLRTLQLNAQAIPIPSADGYVIAFESGLFVFTGNWAEVLAKCTLGANDGALLDRFVDLFFCQVVLGTAAYLDDRPAREPMLAQLGDAFARVCEAFLLAHEYAHITLGHRPRELEAGAGSYHAQGFEARQEFEADELAFRIVMRAFPHPEHVYVSVAGLFAGLHLAERGFALAEGNAAPIPQSGSHPPAIERRRRLLDLMNKLVPPAARELALSSLKKIEDLTIAMWTPLEQGFWHGAWRTQSNLPPDWAPASPEEKSSALYSFKWFCLGPPLSMR
jgi:hypothetical protein